MKYIKLIMVFCVIVVFLPKMSLAQNNAIIIIEAVVVGAGNEPIAGAIVSGSSTEAVTDSTGTFTIQVPENSSLVINASGYKELVVFATDNLDVISMEQDVDLVKLPFRSVDRRDLLGGVSTVNVADLVRKGYTSNPLDGLNSMLGGFSGSSIWGMESLLIVVDGIPRGLDNIRTTEIDQITVLKGANAIALYGPLAANGVIYITTKRGYITDQRVDVRVNSGMYVPRRFPDYLGSTEYMALYNEARRNDGLAPSFTPEDIANSASGLNMYRFPDLDFYSSQFLDNAFNRSDVTAEIYGGDSRARYYTNIGFMHQGSLLNFGEGKNSFDQRFNLRGNVDMDLTEWLNAAVEAGIVFNQGRNPQVNFWQQAATLRPNRFSPLLPISMIDRTIDANRILVENAGNLIDGQYILGGTQLDMTNPIADIYARGYNIPVNRQFMFSTNFDADLSAFTPGLAFRTKIGIDYGTTFNKGYTHEYQVFEPRWATIDGVDIIDSLIPWGLENRSNVQYVGNSWYQQLMYFSGQLDYKRTFDDRHNLFNMLVANVYQYSVSGEYHKTNSTNLGYYLGYNFLNRYYLDFNGSLMYTTKLAPGNRLAFSPVLSLGWRISDEPFMDWLTVIDNLKLNSTVGRIYSDLTIEEHYMYAARFNYRDVGWFTWSGTDGTWITTALRGGNPNLVAPRRDEFSFGFEATLFNRLLDVEANYFSITNSGGIIQAASLFPNYFMTGWPETSFLPYVNYNEERRTGYDFNLRLSQQTGNVDWIFGIVGMYYDTEIIKRAEVYQFDYQEREGKPIDGIWGLQSAGFFADQADIDNSPTQAFGAVRPGDIKYIDQNGDNVIDANDEVLLGNWGWWGSPYTLGVNLTVKWRNLTLFAQGLGHWGNIGMRNRTTDWVFGERKYSDEVLNRWAYYTDPISGEIVDTRETATFPRLTTQSGDNNFRNSDFWLFNNDRFDISRVQVTYSLPQSIIGNTFFRNLDIYVAGSNLFTFAPEREYLETNVGQAPQMRFYNIGISAAF